MPFSIEPIKAFKDNYIWAVICPNKKIIWVVDPGDSAPVIKFIEENNFVLKGILITHHHYDHCDGLEILRAKYNVSVYAPIHPKIQATDTAKEGDEIFLPEHKLKFTVLEIPGHTLDHIAYYCEHGNFIFCGDTLFSAGCGRVFEGTYEQMYNSLMRIAELPEETNIYCTHEYTLENLKFAKKVDPENIDIDSYTIQVIDCMNKQKPSLPSNLLLEKKVNPFLRTAKPSVLEFCKANTNNAICNSVQAFSFLRELKNNFKAT